MYIVKSHKYKCMYMYMDNGSTCTSLLGSHHNVVIPVKQVVMERVPIRRNFMF